MLQVQVVTTFEEILARRAEWEGMVDEQGLGPAHGLEWQRAILEAIGGPFEFFGLILQHGAETVGFATFLAGTQKWHGMPTRVLMPLALLNQLHGTQFVLRPSFEDQGCKAIFCALTDRSRRWDLLTMIYRADERQAVASASALRHLGLPFSVAPGAISPYLELPGSWGALEKSLQSRFRTTLRSRERALRASTSMEVRFFTLPSEMDEALAHIEQIEARSWKQHSGLPITSPVHWPFYRRYAELASARGAVMLPILLVDGEPVAFDFGVLDGDVYHVLQTSFRQDREKMFPGTVLRKLITERLIEQGIREADFGTGDGEWKRKWTRTSRSHQVYTIHRKSLMGRAMRFVGALRSRPTAVPDRAPEADAGGND